MVGCGVVIEIMPEGREEAESGRQNRATTDSERSLWAAMATELSMSGTKGQAFVPSFT
jgi:hypothetical protein